MEEAARAKCEELGIPYPSNLALNNPQTTGASRKDTDCTEETEETIAENA